MVSSWVEIILEACEMIHATKEYDVVVPHEKDRAILNAGIDGNADILVTGDRHLLRRALEKPKIVTAKEFLRILASSNLDEQRSKTRNRIPERYLCRSTQRVHPRDERLDTLPVCNAYRGA